MPTLRKIVATPKIDRPMYQKNIDSGQVERRVHQRVGVAVEPPAHVQEIDLVVGREQLARSRHQRAQVVLLHLPSARDLFDHELRIAAYRDRARRGRARSFEPGDQRSVLGDVVGGLTDALADRREPPWWRLRRVEHDGADGRRAGIAARAAVEVHDHPIEHQGTRIAPQLSQNASGWPPERLICSASMAGIERWHPWHVVPTSRATPGPFATVRQRSYSRTNAGSML